MTFCKRNDRCTTGVDQLGIAADEFDDLAFWTSVNAGAATMQSAGLMMVSSDAVIESSTIEFALRVVVSQRGAIA